MKHIIYQLLPRTFTNYTEQPKHNGTIEENGCGKFNHITLKALREIRKLGATHVWYTGVIEHATQTDYSSYGISQDHPATVKGKAGSPYAIKDYYDVDPDLAEDVPNRLQEWEKLIARTHKAGLMVVMDFVPNHVSRQYHSDAKPAGVRDLGEDDHTEWAFSPLNNFYYIPDESLHLPTQGENPNGNTPFGGLGSYEEFPAKVTGNDCFSASPSVNDWYETVKLNYGVFYQGGGEKQFDPIPDTWLKMRDILLFWARKGVDAFRCDMAEMVPVEFWGWVIAAVKEQFPYIEFIAEVYNPALYRSYIFDGKFDYLYDKVGMYDYLRGVISKNYPAEGITAQWQQTDDIRDRMLYFLENHDEQRIASGFFCGRGAYAAPAMVVLAMLGDNPLMVYAGQEVGERGMESEGFSGIDGRSSIFDYATLKALQNWTNKGKFDGKRLTPEQAELRNFYARLLNLCQTEKAITEGKMFDLTYAQEEGFNKHEEFAFLRSNGEETLLCIMNFEARPATMRLTLPTEAFEYLEMQPLPLVQYVDQLSDYATIQPFLPNKSLTFDVPAWTGMVLKIQ